MLINISKKKLFDFLAEIDINALQNTNTTNIKTENTVVNNTIINNIQINDTKTENNSKIYESNINTNAKKNKKES